MKEPGPDHPIVVEPQPGTVRVRAGGRIVAESRAALRLTEASYPPVLYIPPGDIDGALLLPSERESYCPYKGRAAYHHLALEGGGVLHADEQAGVTFDGSADLLVRGWRAEFFLPL